MVVVLGAIGECLWWVPVDKGMHGDASAECVEMEYVEDVMFVHERLCMCVFPFTSILHTWWHATYEANDFFVSKVEWLEV